MKLQLRIVREYDSNYRIISMFHGGDVFKTCSTYGITIKDVEEIILRVLKKKLKEKK